MALTKEVWLHPKEESNLIFLTSYSPLNYQLKGIAAFAFLNRLAMLCINPGKMVLISTLLVKKGFRQNLGTSLFNASGIGLSYIPGLNSYEIL